MLYEYDNSDFQLGFMQEGDRAFKDKPGFLMWDIPLFHIGARQLRSNTKFSGQTIRFSVNKVVNLFLAVPDNDPSIIIPEGFEVRLLFSTK